MQSNKKSWDIWEITAIKYLQGRDYKILDTNFKFGRFWEIDLIAAKEGLTVFVEVKYRSSDKFGTAEESITKSKLHKCLKTVEYYCKRNKVNFEQIRFDVITVTKQTSSFQLKHYRNIEI